MFAYFDKLELNVVKYFSSLEGAESIEYVEIPLIGGKPAIQNMGANLDTVRITVKLNSAFNPVEDDIKSIRDLKNSGQSFEFVYGNGFYAGRFVIDQISSVVSSTEADGTLISAELTLNLKEAPPDAEIVSRREGEATLDNVNATDEAPPDPV